MSNNRWDGSLNGINYRLVRGGEAYNRFFSKQTIEENLLSVGSGMTSRTDRRKFYQTDWSGGAYHHSPLMVPEISNAFRASRGIDVFSEPGKIKPVNQNNILYETSRGWMNMSPATTAPPLTGSGQTTAYGLNTSYQLRYWDGTAWTSSTGTIGASGSGSWNYWQLIYNAADSYFYAFTGGGTTQYINYTDGTITSGTHAIAIDPKYGASLLAGLQGAGGNVFFYDGDVLYKINDARTALETVTDDGFGPDILTPMPLPSGADPVHPWHQRLAVSTAEGIYYIKNTWGGTGLPQAWLFRVERDTAGNTISVPMATLPAGNVALSIGYSYGNPVILATNNWGDAINNDWGYSTQLWSVFGGTLGLLGTFDVKDPDYPWIAEPWMTVSNIIGHYKGWLALGASQGIWLYDPIRGGISFHQETSPDFQEYYLLYVPWYDGGSFLVQNHYWNDPSRSTDIYCSLGPTDDNYSNRIWSNWFDFGLPGEDKTITKVRTRVNDWDNYFGDHWWVTIYDDERTEVGDNPVIHDHDVANGLVHESSWSVTGEKFMYSIAFNRDNNNPNNDPSQLEGIWITAETGEVVQGWQLRIDGTVFENVNGVRQDPQDVFDNWVAIGQLGTPVTLVDNFEGYDRTQTTSYTVKVQTVSISKGDPNESYVDVTLVEA